MKANRVLTGERLTASFHRDTNRQLQRVHAVATLKASAIYGKRIATVSLLRVALFISLAYIFSVLVILTIQQAKPNQC